MNPFILYIIKAAAYLSVFYLVYLLFLGSDTLYGRNRAYIIITLIGSLILPFITIETAQPVNFPFFERTLTEIIVSPVKSGTPYSGNVSITLPGYILIIYVTGLIISGSRFIIDISELILLIMFRGGKNNRVIRFSGFDTAGFSALGHVFINSRLAEDDEKEVLKHEMNHIEHNHFLDILLIEAIKVIQWFNPFIYLYNRSLRAVHEFQADEECLNSGVEIVHYQKLLMNQVFRTKAFSISNSFSNPTLIKKRMIMMTKERSKKLATLKVLLVVPATAIVMIAFSSCKENNPDVVVSDPVVLDANAKVLVGQQIPDAPPPPPPPPPGSQSVTEPLQVVDEMPLFPGGDAALLKFIGANTVYPPEAVKKGIQGRIIIKFAVEPDGTISRISVLKGVNPELDAESMRVVGLLPKFEKPGMQDGKPVPVWFMVPITFALK